MALLETLTDPFISSNLNTQLWTQNTAGSATFTYGNGATVNYPASSTSSTDGDISSVTTYNLTGSHIFMQILSVPSSATSADAALQTRVDANNIFNWTKEGNTIYAQKKIATVTATLNSTTFNPVTHGWWQIRESGGTIYWDTSSDGISWVNFTSFVNVLTITSMTVVIAGTCFQNETNPGTFSWRYLNSSDSTGPYNHLRVGNGMSRAEVAN